MTITPKHQKYWLLCGIRWDHIDATFETYDKTSPDAAEALVAMRDFWEDEKGVFAILSGDYGTGKSHLAAATIRAAGTGVFATNSELLALHRSLPFNGERDQVTKSKLMDTLKTCPVLVIDEIGIASGGVDENALLDEVLSFRADRKSPTVLTTNVGLSRLAEFLGGRLMDRINQSVNLIPPVSGSRRIGRESARGGDIPQWRFTGALPDKWDYFKPYRWTEFTKARNMGYREYKGIPDWMGEIFETWKLENPIDETPK